jgi:peptidoglycan/LPS O-acetylase OafA/YrhL
MLINIQNPILQNTLFSILLITTIVISSKKDSDSHKMLISHTNELKGIAILMVVFSHIGYFLSTDSRFLYPYSIDAGVGVNIFLFLSGYGLAISALTKGISVKDFYKRKFPGIYIPMWIVLTLVFLLDALIIKKYYNAGYILKSLVGFFPSADIYNDVDSPLWYFTFIIGYYLMFPIIFKPKRPILSAVFLLFVSLVIFFVKLPIAVDVQNLYKLHIMPFPLGIGLAVLLKQKPIIAEYKRLADKIDPYQRVLTIFRYTIIVICIVVFLYTSFVSGVGKGVVIEQSFGTLTALCVILISLLKKTKSVLLELLGLYSYEIYLFHWPFLYRYDILLHWLPPYFAVFLYLPVLLGLGYYLHLISGKLIGFISK